MSSIRSSLEKLDRAVGKLDFSVTNVEQALHEYPPEVAEQAPELRDNEGNVVDVDFVAKRLDKAIATVEELLKDEG